jgi:hypothetical protein
VPPLDAVRRTDVDVPPVTPAPAIAVTPSNDRHRRPDRFALMPLRAT